MSRFVVTYLCWNCDKEYTSAEVYVLAQKDKEGIICPECGGYIANPQGKTRTKGVRLDD